MLSLFLIMTTIYKISTCYLEKSSMDTSITTTLASVCKPHAPFLDAMFHSICNCFFLNCKCGPNILEASDQPCQPLYNPASHKKSHYGHPLHIPISFLTNRKIIALNVFTSAFS